MTVSENFNIRLDPDLREQAFAVFSRYGLSAAQAFKLFLHQVVKTNAIPLSLNYQSEYRPNFETRQAIEEAINRTDFSDALGLEDALKLLRNAKNNNW